MNTEFFTKLWSSIDSGIRIEGDIPLRYSIYTLKVCGTIDDAMSLLRSGKNDYIFIHGVVNDRLQREAIGLLCTNGVRQLADIDTVFFVGYLKSKEDDVFTTNVKENCIIVIPFYQLEGFLTDRARFRIGSVMLISNAVSDIVDTETFIDAIYDLGRGNDWDE